MACSPLFFLARGKSIDGLSSSKGIAMTEVSNELDVINDLR